MLAVVVPLAFAFALPPTNETSRYQLDADLHLTPAIADLDSYGNGDSAEVHASAQLQLTMFIQRVRDDDAAPSLQPFLQRVARVRVAVSGAVGFSYVADDGPPFQRDDGGPTVRAAIDGYVARYLYLGASVGYQLQHRWVDIDNGSTENVHEPSLAVAIGARLGDVRIAATAGATFAVGEGDQANWEYVGLRAHAVIHRFIELDGGAELRLWPAADGGAGKGGGGDASATFWLGRRLGLGIGGFYRQGFGSDLGIQTDTQAGGAVSIRWWLSPRALFSFAYRTIWEPNVADPSLQESRIDLALTLGLSFRL